MLAGLLFMSNLMFMLYDIHQHQHHLYIIESVLIDNQNKIQIFIATPPLNLPEHQEQRKSGGPDW